MKLLKLTVLPIILMFSMSTSALIIDFKHMGDGFLGYGESAWAPLDLNADFGVDISIEGYTSSGLAWAYLDTGKAGLGVCGNIQSDKTHLVNMKRGGGQNLCDPPSDDNVGTAASEYLKITFNQAVTVGSLWFNNNHDVDQSLIGDTITIDGVDVTFAAGDLDLSRTSNYNGDDLSDVRYDISQGFSAGDTLILAANDEEFYFSAMTISTPEPSSLALLGLSLLGLGLARRRKA